MNFLWVLVFNAFKDLDHKDTIGTGTRKRTLRAHYLSMAIVRLKIDVSGTVGDQAWREIQQFDQIQSANFGPQFGSGGLSLSHVAPAAPPSEARPNPYPNMPSRTIWNKSASSTPTWWIKQPVPSPVELRNLPDSFPVLLTKSSAT